MLLCPISRTNEIGNKLRTNCTFLFSSLLGSSFPRNPLTYQKGGFLEILFLGVGLISNPLCFNCIIKLIICTD